MTGYDIKGWCPGALRPMASGDGLVVRIRPHGGRLSAAQAAGIAAAALAHGNGEIDLSARANLQLRGIAPATVNRHREHIRRKLELTGRRVNLVSHLQGLAPAPAP